MTDQMQSEIAELNAKMEKIDDPRRCYALVQERIRQLQLRGWEIPQDLALIERRLATECLCESQGR
jgi:hypothetical protein